MTAAIIGVAESDLGNTGRSALQLEAQAISRALDDAGLSLADVDGLCTASLSRYPAGELVEYLGLSPRWTDSSFSGGASFELFLGRAADAIANGLCDVALVAYGSNARSAPRRLGDRSIESLSTQFEAPYRPLNPITLYALAAQRHMHEFGTTPEQLACVAAAAREWALLNPAAYRHGAGPLSVEDVLASDVVSSPLHVLDCCLVTDGGGAVVLTSVERARTLRRPPVVVLGYGEVTRGVSFSQIADLTDSGAGPAADAAFRAAGIDRADVDVVQLYDSFTITVLLLLEGTGLVPRGEAGPFAADRGLGPNGSFPINTSGGGLSYCHPGMFGIFLAIEAVRQLRGEAGARQLPRAETAFCHGTGGMLSTHGSLVLGVDR